MNGKRRPSRAPLGKDQGQVGVLIQPSLPTDVSFRLWSVRSSPNGSGWSCEDPVVFLIADLVAACGGVTVDQVPLTAHFSSPAQAVSALKSIFRAVVEYSSSGDAHPAGLAAAAYSATEPDTPPDSTSPRAWLDQSQPGQILLGPEIWESLKSMPGLQFRSATLDACALGPARNDIHELLWAPDDVRERYSELVRSQQSSGSTATVWIQSSQLPRLSGEPTTSQPNVTSSLNLAHQTVPPDFSSDEPQTQSSKLYWMVAAGLAVALVIAFFAFRKPAANSKIALPAATQVSSQTLPPAPVRQSPVPQSSPPPVEPAPEAQQSPPEPTPNKRSRSHHAKTVAANHPEGDQADDSSTPPQEAAVEGFTARDIPLLLKKADRDGGDGRFNDARREYNIVLKLEPSNAEAKQGLHRLALRESEQ